MRNVGRKTLGRQTPRRQIVGRPDIRPTGHYVDKTLRRQDTTTGHYAQDTTPTGH